MAIEVCEPTVLELLIDRMQVWWWAGMDKQRRQSNGRIKCGDLAPSGLDGRGSAQLLHRSLTLGAVAGCQTTVF